MEKREFIKTATSSLRRKKKTVRPRRRSSAGTNAAGRPSKIRSLALPTGKTSVTRTKAISVECDGTRLRKVMEGGENKRTQGQT